MHYDFIVLGGTGLQGRICVRDLVESGYSVLLCGRDPSSIQPLLRGYTKRVRFQYLDLKNKEALVKCIRLSGAKVVVNCAELTFNLAIMRACLAVGVSCTDLGGLQHITARQFALHHAFARKGILCLTGCGSTPGIANVMARYGAEQLDAVRSIDLGFAWDSTPKVFVVPYSLPSIFTEFREKPVIFSRGNFVTKPYYTRVRTFRGIGQQTLRGIVHSEVYTLPRYLPSLRSVRYFAGFPEHSLTYIKALLALDGDSSHELPYTLQLLKQLTPPKGYREQEVILVILQGTKGGKKKTVVMECFVQTLPGWEEAGSNIDTGRAMSIFSQMLLKGEIKGEGVHAPEGIVPWKPFFRALHARSMYVYCNGKRIRVCQET